YAHALPRAHPEKKERRAEPYREKKRFYKSRQKFSKLDTFHKCGRFGHYAKDGRVKEKIKNLDIDDNIKESLCKIMLNSDSGKLETEHISNEESSTSDDLKALHQEDYMSSDDDCFPCQQGLISVIDNDKVIEILQIVKDPKIRAQIIDKINNTSTSHDHIREDIPTKEERRKLVSSPTTIGDLKHEINNFKDGIQRLKEKNVTIEIRLDNFESLKDLSNSSESSSYEEGSKDLDFLKTLNFGEISSIEIDNTLQNPKLQDNIAILKNHFAILICGDHPNAFWNRKKH
ncbi:hypothetical protein H5410_061953, partial [Solanum commersonii]